MKDPNDAGRLGDRCDTEQRAQTGGERRTGVNPHSVYRGTTDATIVGRGLQFDRGDTRVVGGPV